MSIVRRRLFLAADVSSLIIIVLCAIGVAMIGYWTLFDYKSPFILIHSGDTFRAGQGADAPLVRTVRGGDHVYIDVAYCLSEDDPEALLEAVKQGRADINPVNPPEFKQRTRLSGFIRDGVMFSVPVQSGPSQQGCFQGTFPFEVPKSLPPGDYQYLLRFETFNNPVQRLMGGVIVPFNTVRFHIL